MATPTSFGSSLSLWHAHMLWRRRKREGRGRRLEQRKGRGGGERDFLRPRMRKPYTMVAAFLFPSSDARSETWSTTAFVFLDFVCVQFPSHRHRGIGSNNHAIIVYSWEQKFSPEAVHCSISHAATEYTPGRGLFSAPQVFPPDEIVSLFPLANLGITVTP